MSDLKEIINENIATIIGRYVNLTKKGSKLVGCCPIHGEKSASFTVNLGGKFTNKFKCYGCGAFGDALDFIQEVEKVDFVDAVRLGAGILGREVPAYNKGEKDARNTLIETLKQDQILFLDAKATIKPYLKNRKISSETAALFGLGYSKSGFFAGRLTMPLRNTIGDIVGFTARVMGDEKPKYLHTAESLVFDKSKILFGLSHAKQAIAKASQVIIVEGQFDVMSMVQQGVGNVVATSGTALSEYQAKALARLAREAIILTDGDQAGRKAVARYATELLKTGMNVNVVSLPEGEDPDSIFRCMVDDDIVEYIDTRKVGVISYVIENQTPETPIGERVKPIIELLATMPDRYDRESEKNSAAALLNVKPGYLNDDLQNLITDPKELELWGLELAQASDGAIHISHSKQTVIDHFIADEMDWIQIAESISDTRIETVIAFLADQCNPTIVYSIDEHFGGIFQRKSEAETNSVHLLKRLYAKRCNISIAYTESPAASNISFDEWYIRELVTSIRPGEFSMISLAIERAAEIISFQPQSVRMVRMEMLKTLFKNEGIKFSMTDFRTVMTPYIRKNAPKERSQSTVQVNNEDDLDDEQMMMFQNYQMFFRGNRTWIQGENQVRRPWTNFIIKPLLHSNSTQEIQKLFRIINIENDEQVISLSPSKLNNVTDFCCAIEERGNYNFEGGKPELLKIKKFLMDETIYATKVETLGWQVRGGFWAWANGVSLPSGEFLPTDEIGIVKVKDINYFLPMNSELYAGDETVYVNDRKFKWKKGDMQFNEFAQSFVNVFGEKSLLTLSGYMMSVVSDIVFKKLNFVPIFNLFGPKGSGKTEQATSLYWLFGGQLDIANISSITQYALAHIFSAFMNGIVVTDEYKNTVGPEKNEALKSVFNRQGRMRGSFKEGVKYEKSQVNSLVFMCGQEMPTADVALMSRCVFHSIYKTSYTFEEQEIYNAFQDTIKTEGLTQITIELVKYRKHIETGFGAAVEKWQKTFKAETNRIDSRLVSNYSAVMAISELFSQKIELGYSINTLKKVCLDAMKEQQAFMENSNEMASFWSIFSSLISEGSVKDKTHFLVNCLSKLKYRKPVEGKMEEVEELYPRGKHVLFLRFEGLHALYSIQAAKMRIKPQESTTLEYYLKHSGGYMGQMGAKRFATGTTSCMLFDVAVMHRIYGIQLINEDLTEDLNSDLDEYTEAAEPKDKLPF